MRTISECGSHGAEFSSLEAECIVVHLGRTDMDAAYFRRNILECIHFRQNVFECGSILMECIGI